jgi:hypothetical protein
MKGKLVTSGLLGLVLAGLIAAPAGAQQYKHPKLAAWYQHEGGKRMISSITSDSFSVADAANNASNSGDTSGVLTACQNLANDVAIAQSDNSIPSKSVQRLWSHSLNELSNGATLCVNGINDNDANGEIEQATSNFDTARALIDEIVRQLH